MRRSRYKTIAIGLFAGAIGVLLARTSARADEPEIVGSAAEKQAAVLCREALIHVRKGEFEEARRLYEDAYHIAPDAPILFNLGLTELNGGHPLEAIASFRAYIKNPKADPAKVTRISAELLPKAVAATGHLDVKAAPPHSHFAVDGHDAEPSEGAVLDVLPGPHHVTATSDLGTTNGDVIASAGETTPVLFSSLVDAVGRDLTEEQKQAKASQPTPIVQPEKRSASARVPVSLAIGGAAVAAAIGGFVFYELNGSAYSRWQTLHEQMGTTGCNTTSLALNPQNAGPCDELQSNNSNVRTYYYAANALFVASGVLAAGAVFTYVLWPSRVKTTGVNAAPFIDPVGRSMGLVGAF